MADAILAQYAVPGDEHALKIPVNQGNSMQFLKGKERKTLVGFTNDKKGSLTRISCCASDVDLCSFFRRSGDFPKTLKESYGIGRHGESDAVGACYHAKNMMGWDWFSCGVLGWVYFLGVGWGGGGCYHGRNMMGWGHGSMAGTW